MTEISKSQIFSLTEFQSIELKPGEKIIPQKLLHKLMDAVEVLNLAKAQAIEYRKEVTTECEKIKELSFEEGFQEGLKSLNHHIVSIHQELKNLQNDIQNKVLPLALSAARKIMGEELKLHPDRIVNIVINSLKPVLTHKKVTIYVNRQDLDTIEKNKPKIKQLFEQIENLSVLERNDVESGGCMIETEAGIINAQLENQWKALENAFQSFMGN